MAIIPSVSIQSLWGIASKEHKTSITWSCHIVDMKTVVKNSEKNIRLVLDVWAFWDLNNSKIFDKMQLEKLGDLSKINGVFISHVHNDHIGNLVHLVKAGYAWPIYMSHTSKALLVPILQDILSILKQEQEAIEEKNKRLWSNLNKALSIVNSTTPKPQNQGKSHSKESKETKRIEYTEDQIIAAKTLLAKYNIVKNEDIATVMHAITPLKFDEQDIIATLWQIQSFERGGKLEFLKEDGIIVSSKLYRAWHVEWAAQTLFSFWYNAKNPQEQYRVLFTGDLWRIKEPLLLDTPEAVKERVDVTLIESTYGNRIHNERTPELEKLADEINTATWHVLIPAFSLWRSTDVLSQILQSVDNGDIQLQKDEKIYVDGKLTKNLMLELLKRYPQKYHFLTHKSLHIIETDEERKNLHKKKWRVIILGSGGMLQWWTSITHAHKILDKRNAKLLFVWFQAPGTRWNYLQNNKGWVYNFNWHKKMKNKLYHPEYTLEKIRNRDNESIIISWQSTKELEKIIIDLYSIKDQINLWKDEFIYVPKEFWEDERIKKEIFTLAWKSYNPRKYGPSKMIEKTETKLYNYNKDIYDYFIDKIKVFHYEGGGENEKIISYNAIDDDEDGEISNTVEELKWVVINRDNQNKINVRAKLVHFSTFSWHADRDELIEVMENHNQKNSRHTTILVHWDQEASKEFKNHIEKNKRIKGNVIIWELYNTLTFNCTKKPIL